MVTAIVWYSAEVLPVPGNQKKALWIYLTALNPGWLSDPPWSLFTPRVFFQDIVEVVSEGQAEVWEPVLSGLRLWPRRLSASLSLQEGSVVPAPSQVWRGWSSGEARSGLGLGFNIGRIPSRLCTGSWFWISWFWGSGFDWPISGAAEAWMNLPDEADGAVCPLFSSSSSFYSSSPSFFPFHELPLMGSSRSWEFRGEKQSLVQN